MSEKPSRKRKCNTKDDENGSSERRDVKPNEEATSSTYVLSPGGEKPCCPSCMSCKQSQISNLGIIAGDSLKDKEPSSSDINNSIKSFKLEHILAVDEFERVPGKSACSSASGNVLKKTRNRNVAYSSKSPMLKKSMPKRRPASSPQEDLASTSPLTHILSKRRRINSLASMESPQQNEPSDSQVVSENRNINEAASVNFDNNIRKSDTALKEDSNTLGSTSSTVTVLKYKKPEKNCKPESMDERKGGDEYDTANEVAAASPSALIFADPIDPEPPRNSCIQGFYVMYLLIILLNVFFIAIYNRYRFYR